MPLLDLLVLTNDDVGTIAFFNVRGVLHDSTPSHSVGRLTGCEVAATEEALTYGA
jgi:hypothetical protein